jgi:formate hydrogenlyase regulatory protein HycA
MPNHWEVQMAIPEKIPIVREENYRTHYIGRYGEGNQFMGFVTATIPMPLPEDWQNHKRWYTVLHTFDSDGNHLDTEHWFAGTTADGEAAITKRALQKLQEMLAALGSIEYCDVEIRLFELEIDGHRFGLVPVVEPEEEYESIHLFPNDLAFFEPWDGYYDT